MRVTDRPCHLRLPMLVLCIVLTAELCRPAAADLWGASVDPYSTAPPETADQYNRVFRFETQGNKLGNDIGHARAGLN
jgi:hypothetical protein